MKLAIICEMPKVIGKVVTGPVTVSFGGESLASFEDGIDHVEHDLSASAEQSAKDAFAYCPGPFGLMSFIREDPRANELVMPQSDWILRMAHDCLVDIQAFEVAENALLNKFSKSMIFEKWTPSGPRVDRSSYFFAKVSPSGEKRLSSNAILGRVLIEPEPVE